MDIKTFCELIAKDYLYFLYKNNDGFPNCCHTSANLLASYLAVYFDSNFTHKKLITSSSHGWAENNEYMLDFTGFQFYISDEEKTVLRDSNKFLSKDDVFSIVQKYQNKAPIFGGKEYDCFKESLIECELFGISEAHSISGPYTLDGFMSYVEKSIQKVDELVISSDIYS